MKCLLLLSSVWSEYSSSSLRFASVPFATQHFYPTISNVVFFPPPAGFVVIIFMQIFTRCCAYSSCFVDRLLFFVFFWLKTDTYQEFCNLCYQLDKMLHSLVRYHTQTHSRTVAAKYHLQIFHETANFWQTDEIRSLGHLVSFHPN